MNTKKFDLKKFLLNNNTYVIFLVLFIICAVLSSTFLDIANLTNILLQQSGPILVALGMLFVVLTGGIDLSVGAVTALSSCVAYVLMRDYQVNFVLAFLAALVMGLLIGLLNGLLVAYGGMQGFVTTLATLSIGNGFALIVSNGAPVRCSDVQQYPQWPARNMATRSSSDAPSSS